MIIQEHSQRTSESKTLNVFGSQQKIKKLTLKLFMSHMGQNVFNFDESLKLALSAMKSQIQQDQNTAINEGILIRVAQQMKELVGELKNIPEYWLDKLQKNQIEKQNNKIRLNCAETITEIYEDILESVNQKVFESGSGRKNQGTEGRNEVNNEDFDFESLYCDESVKNLFSNMLNHHSKHIYLNFQNGKDYILEQIKLVEEQIKNSAVMNPYLLFGILKQMSHWTFRKARQNFLLNFPESSSVLADRFCRFLQKNYGVIDLAHSTNEGRILTQQQKQKIGEQRMANLFNFIFESFQTQKKMLLMENFLDYSQQKQQQKQIPSQIIEGIIQLNKPKKKKRQKKCWRKGIILKKLSTFCFQMKDTVQRSINTEQTFNKYENKKIVKMGLMQEVTIGGVLGKCLADIDQFQNASDFFKTFSKTAMIGGSICLILEQVPILNYFVIAGALSYTVYRNYRDQITTSLRKMKQIGKASIIAVGAVTSTIAGMIIGQIAIPVPFLGAFVGGVIGGYLGQRGSRSLTTILKKNSFMKLIDYLLKSVIEGRRWEYSEELLANLSINQKYFSEKLCSRQSQKNIYITALCFLVVAHYQSVKQLQHTEEKVKQKQKQQKQKKVKQSYTNEDLQIYSNQFNLVKIVQYLSTNQMYLVGELPIFEASVMHLVN